LLLVVACGTSRPQVGPDAAPDGPPPAPDEGLVIYLNYEGVTLNPTPGAPEASTNTTNVVSAVTTVPPYLMGDASRATEIATITAEVKTRLASLDVSVVTDRPAVPGYYMIVVSGAASVLGAGWETADGTSSVTFFGCTATPPVTANPHGISFLFQSSKTADVFTARQKANGALANLALAQGFSPTLKKNDCLCLVDASCGFDDVACTIGGASTPIDAMHACPGAPATFDEDAALLATFGAHR
jgi:hypothetical protein